MIKQVFNEVLTVAAMMIKSVTYLIRIVYVWFRAFSTVSEHSADEYTKEATAGSKHDSKLIDLDNL